MILNGFIIKISFFCFLFSTIFSDTTFSQIEDYYLGENLSARARYQRFKEIEGDVHKFANEKIEKEGKIAFLYGFDMRGNVIKEQVYQNKKEKTKSDLEYVYNNDDVLIESIEFDSKGKIKIKCKYVYDENGRLIERLKNKSSGKLSSHIKYKYDAQNFKIEEEWFNQKGTIYEDKKFEYDKNGNLIEETHYNDDNSIGEHYKYKYDTDDRLTEKISLYSDGSIYERWVIKYDLNGNRELESHYFSDEQPECVLKYCYDDDFNVSEIQVLASSGKIFKLIKYIYRFYEYNN